MSRPDDATSLTLLGRLRDNDQDAWTRLVRLYGPLVQYWAGRWGATGADAEDVAQDVFRRAAGGLAAFQRDKPGDTFRGWLRVIARNAVRDHQRRAGQQARASGGTEALAQMNAVADDPADEPDAPAETAGLYRRALELVKAEFEPQTWRAFWAVAVDGRPTADVAADLGLSAAAVRQAKSRVLRRLKEEAGDLIE